jgi:hypothetical protein
VNKLVGAKTLPDNFRQKVMSNVLLTQTVNFPLVKIQMSLRCSFKKNMLVEVINKYRVSQMRVGKISEVVCSLLFVFVRTTIGLFHFRFLFRLAVVYVSIMKM